jgi:hypothetical protein
VIARSHRRPGWQRLSWPARQTRVTPHRALSLLLSGLLFFQFNACTAKRDAGADEPLSLSECQQQEAVGYPEMEEVARSTLAGVDITMHRSGGCEDTGSPRTVLSVTVKEWPNRRVAARFFEAHGWVSDDGGGSMESPDGAYWVNHVTSFDADDPDSYVTLAFYEHADDPGGD